MAIPPRQLPSASTGASAPQAPQRPTPKPPQGQQATPQQKGGVPSPRPGSAPPRPGAEQPKPGAPSPQSGTPAGGTSKPNPSQGPVGNTPNTPTGPKSAGNQASPSGSPPGPPPLPEGPSPELESAYKFLQDYVSSNMPPGSLPPQMLNDIDAETSQSVLSQIGSKIPTTITGAPKIFPKYSLAVGSPSSPNLPTGQNMPQTNVSEPNLIGGLPVSRVKVQQMDLKNV